jgi:ectoine hydroxylase-related dioxygenase (phytanoyl-CoA dioxygenase family)
MPTPKRLHNNDIYFRVVMASEEKTISVPHRDEYFHRITPSWVFADDEESIKVWIPLFCPSEIALGIVPGSHKDYSHGNASYQFDDEHPSFHAPHVRSELTPIKVPPGQCLIFPSMLIHGSLGVPALDPLRISVEISPVLSK